ncbi:MAG: insulinase family protein [Halieaceae bacterium]|jgi:secreted Zn-dependent insulinase-like peptidase|nr:insulinase family protein [Halieaceae bacterium]
MPGFPAATAAARSFITLILLLLLPAAFVTAAPTVVAPVQSPNDDFSYRLLTLDNGLKALLVSNPDTPKAAASLDVQVGSGDNPRDRGGLAHFLEHMLFLGTEKYPDPAEYERFITEHGGSRNAYTSFEHTNYFFDVDAEHFEGALDRFAQFFIAPKMDAAYVERERNAVHAEFQMGLKSDGRRGLDVLQASMNPQHPFSRFTVGSLETLADRPDAPVRDDLLEFYERYYSANLMRLVVVAREPLDKLEKMVVKRFEAVPNRGTELEAIDAPLFVDARLPMLLKIKPQGTLRELQVNFAIDDYRPLYEAKPMSYLSNLVGHEGEGSLLSALKREGLADGLSSGTGLSWRGGALFSVNVALTEKGVGEYERVLARIFAYLELLRERGAVKRIHDEQASLAELAFRFREPVAPIRYASSLSNSMHYYSDADILRGPYLMTRYDEALIEKALDGLRAERAQVVLTAPEVSTDSVSPYYEVPYARLGPEAVLLARWKGESADGEEDFRAGLALPEPNPFIAENVELLPLAEDNPAKPQLAVDDDRVKVWHRQASDFRVPKGALYLSFRSPIVGATPQQWASASLYTRVVTDALNEYTYPALLAGVGFSYYRHNQGLGLRISGYNDKQLKLLEDLLDEIGGQRFDADRFERLRREMVLELQNTVARRPASQLMDRVRQGISAGEFADEQLIEALNALSIDDLRTYRDRFWTSVRVEALLYGNHGKGEAQRLAGLVREVLGEGEGLPALAPQVMELGAGDSLQLEVDIDHNDAVVGWYLQGAGRDWSDRAAVALTAKAIESGFFQQLRTEQQLGYIVQSFAWPQYDLPGLMLLIQSPSHSAADVQSRMDAFLAATIDDTAAEQFERYKEALINDLLKPHDNLSERAEFYWQSIAFRESDFDRPERLAQAVRSMSFEAWKDYYQRVFLDERRSLLAVSTGAQGEAPRLEGARLFRDPAKLREEVGLTPVDLAPL